MSDDKTYYAVKQKAATDARNGLPPASIPGGMQSTYNDVYNQNKN